MKVKAKLRAPKLNLAAYKDALERYMTDKIKEGCLEWLQTVILIVPNWTGASQATFMKLAQAIQWGFVVTGRRAGEGQVASEGELITSIEDGFRFRYQTDLPWLVWNEEHNANVDPDPTKYPPPARLKRPGPYNFEARAADAFRQFAATVTLPEVAPYIVGVDV